MYTTAFHASIEDEETPQAVRLAEYIDTYVDPDTLYDFGCSTGIYVREMKARRPAIRAHGYEFSQDAIDNAVIPDSIIHRVNLTESECIDIETRVGNNTLGICLEVLEHIEDAKWPIVLGNIIRNCNILIFSAALPGQGGTGHINCRPRIDWIRRFAELGWVVDLDATQHLVNFMRGGVHMGWFVNNAIVLVPRGDEHPVYFHNHYLF